MSAQPPSFQARDVKKRPVPSDHQQYMFELQAQKAKYNRDLSTIVTSKVAVPMKSLHAVIAKELGAEQLKLQKQIEHWQSHAMALQLQLDDLAGVQGQLDELKAIKLRAEETRLRDFTLDADAVSSSGSAVDQSMMLKSQQQRIRELSRDKSRLEENMLALVERFAAFTQHAGSPPLPQDMEADIVWLREQYNERLEAAVARVKKDCDAEREKWQQQRQRMEAIAEEKAIETKRLAERVQQQNREIDRLHKRIIELADSEMMEARLSALRVEMDRAASASAATIRKLHAQVTAQAKQYSILEKLVGPSIPSPVAAASSSSATAAAAVGTSGSHAHASPSPTANQPTRTSSYRVDISGTSGVASAGQSPASPSHQPLSSPPPSAAPGQGGPSPVMALAYMRDSGGSGSSAASGRAVAGAGPGADAQLNKLRLALDKITTSPGALGEEGGQQEWHERYSKAYDDLQNMQLSLRQQQQQQQQQQQSSLDDPSQQILSAIQSKLAGDVVRRRT